MNLLDKSASKNQLIDILNSMKFPIMGAGGGFAPIGFYGWSADYVTGAPQGWLRCEGQEINIADYPELATFYASQHGASNYWGGDGITTFAVPDLRGEFIRGAGTNSHANQGDGANVGVHQDGTRHIATSFIQESGDYYFVGTKNNVNENPTNADAINTYAGQFFNTASGNNNTTRLSDYTSRPTNTSGVFFVKATVAGDPNGHVYSTEEQIVGMTEDGEVLYEKTFKDISITSSGWTSMPHNISNYKKLENVARFAITMTNGYTMSLGSSTQNGVDANTTTLEIHTTSSSLPASATVTIQYTKTQS